MTPVRAVLHEISAIAVADCIVLAVIFAGLIIRRLVTDARKRRQRKRPRLGRRGIGPAIEHISMAYCPDCTPRHPCAIHLRPRPGDDLDRWDAELRQPRLSLWRRHILWEDQHQ